MNDTPSKPLLRGVLHEVAAFVAAIAAAFLVITAPGPRARFGALVYGMSLVTLLAVSAIYHRPTWPEKARRVLRRLDHSAIFLLIAGTYTPLSFLIRSRTGWLFLAIVWGGALVGIAISIFWVGAPKALVAAVCVLLGWAALPVLPAINAVLGTSAVVLLAAGGVTYSLGAAVYALRKPDLYPRVFGYHELFHALVIVAAGFHFAAVARAVAALPA
jgi:hemolysin III